MITWTDTIFRPDPQRVLVRFFTPGTRDRVERVISRVLSLSPEAVKRELNSVIDRFSKRHRNIQDVLLQHYDMIEPCLITDRRPTESRKLLLGAYFTSEYALESAALFNPSVVPHPDQSGLPEGSLRFVLSLRATGEGHMSSLEFREGVIHKDRSIETTKASELASDPQRVANPIYNKKVFGRKLRELGYENHVTQHVLEALGDSFNLAELQGEIDKVQRENPHFNREVRDALTAVETLAEENYEVRFAADCPFAERVILPPNGGELRAIEDARFVQFHDESDGQKTYYATYTALSDSMFLPQLLETKDFTTFKFITLNGDGAQNKGMALFPRKINGQYVMLSRQDGEHLFIITSDNIHFWHDPAILMRPSQAWEFVQLGNCGSPIETPEGWLVLTHGVGAMRRYCIGAILLDLENPRRIIGRLPRPLLQPTENNRDGYVPNVVYTCGGMVFGDTLVLPYGMADYASRIALCNLPELLKKLKKAPPK